MALIFKCNTCSKRYDAQIISNIIYMDGNKRIALKNENDDCESCSEEIKKATAQKRTEIKQQNGNN